MISPSQHYLNAAVLDAIYPVAFRAQPPYPWINPQHFIADDRYPGLLESMPDIAQFRAFFGKQRKHGQSSHDRYVLDYEDGMELSPAWSEFVGELRSDRYRDFVCSLLDVSHVRFRFHWHFTPNGGEVSPHCDSKGKIGSQIFYLNNPSHPNLVVYADIMYVPLMLGHCTVMEFTSLYVIIPPETFQ